MGRFELKDVDDSLNEFVVIFAEKLGNYFVIVLQDLIEASMDSVFLELNSMVEDDIQPVFTNIQLGDPIAFDDLPDEVISSIEYCLQSLILLLIAFIDLIQNFSSNLSNNRKQNPTNLQLHTHILQFLHW